MRIPSSLSILTLLATATSHASVISMTDDGQIFSQVSVPSNLGIAIDVPRQNVLGFTINVNYTGTAPPVSQQMAFTDAATAWMTRITGYRGTMSVGSVTINAEIAPGDGPGGVLGSAGPTLVSIQDEDGVAGGPSFALVTQGEMTFDSADIANLETAGTLGAVIEHEMGHVLGIGTLWNTASDPNPIYADTQAFYIDGSGEYTGPQALAQWQTEFSQPGAAFVPVELGGGAGTADGHWNEVDNGAGLTGITQIGTGKDMRDELMTGWLNPNNFVSQMTIESLGDIGYTVTSLVPEPSTSLLVFLGVASCMRRRR